MEKKLPFIGSFVAIVFSLPLAAAIEFAAAEALAANHGALALKATESAITEADLRRYVTRLASEEYEGRGTGDRGERMATSYLATFFAGLGLQPAGEDEGYFQNFEFRAGMRLSGANALTITVDEPVGVVRRLEPGEHYQPLSFSTSGTVAAGIAFAGFGIEAGEHRSFDGLDVKGKWVLVLRGSPHKRQDLVRFGPLVTKARLAQEKGAAGIIFVTATNPEIGSDVIPPGAAVGGRGEILPAITISDRLAGALLTGQSGEDGLRALFEQYYRGGRVAGYLLPWRLEAEIGIEANRDPGRNVLARLQVGASPSKEAVVIGAHIDHLGFGNRGGTRARGEEAQKIHFGADDNASGVAAVMELAQFFAAQKAAGTLALNRDLVFAGWSGEEVGLHGSSHFISEAKKASDNRVYPGVAAYLNLDMVGRARENGLTIQGTASSREWNAILDALPVTDGLKIMRSPSPFLPTDATPFYEAGVPVLAAFTGLHDDYHTPGDTVDKIDFGGLGKVSQVLKELTGELARRPSAPGYVELQRAGARDEAPPVRIGLVPEDVEGGVRVTEVMADSPCARAGLREGDVIVKLDNSDVEDTAGLFAVLHRLKADVEYELVVRRGEEAVTLRITPERRE